MNSGFLPSLKSMHRIWYQPASTCSDPFRCNFASPWSVNRGIELSNDLVNSERSVILDQVENGVAVRAAILYLILGGDAL